MRKKDEYANEAGSGPFSEDLIKEFNFVHSLAKKMTAYSHNAEDFAQLTLLKAWQKRSTFRGECMLKCWLKKILLNVVLDYDRKHREILIDMNETDNNSKNHYKVYNMMFGKQAEAWKKDPEALCEQKEIFDRFHKLTENLTRMQRKVIILRIVNELQFEEISRVLTIGLSTARTHFYRSRMNIKENLCELLDA